MVDTETQNANFIHLLELAINQKHVRDCRIEGMVYDIESQIKTAAELELITFSQEESILAVFK